MCVSVCVWVWGMCSIWTHVYISARRSHMKHACALSIIWRLRVCLTWKSSLDWAHVLFICLSPPVQNQAYTYTYRNMCQCQLWGSIDRPFVFDWQVWLPSGLLCRTCVQTLVRVSVFDFDLFKEKCCRHSETVADGNLSGCICACPYMYTLLCVRSDNRFARSSHSCSVTQSGVCAFFQSIPFIL